MAFVTDKAELKPGLVLFRRGDVDHRMWYCRMKIPKADRYKTVSLKTTDIEVAREDLLNSRMAYVAVSRSAEDAQVYTKDREKMPEALGHHVSHESAHVPVIKPKRSITPQPEIAPVIEDALGMGHSL